MPNLRAFLVVSLLCGTACAAERQAEVVIYGGTSGGIAAAVQVARMQRSVLLIEPGRHLGGLTSGGLGATDIGNKQAIGGIAREFYERVFRHYSQAGAWVQESLEQYRKRTGHDGVDADTMWLFEPSAADTIFQTMLAEAGVVPVLGQRLDRRTGVSKRGARIVSITMESGDVYRGQIFIDATYEGDLMAAAGVEYAVGREPNKQYGETVNGVTTRMDQAGLGHHQFVVGVDPYIRAGDPSSGMLPFIDPNGPGAEGHGDARIQAYNFRMCLTDDPANRVPIGKPEGYDERWYELLFRNFEAGAQGAKTPRPDCTRSSGSIRAPWINSPMPNRKTDTNNQGAVSTDFIGQNYDYPEADYAEREKIIARHRLWQQGLMWTLANHPRVPATIRKEVSRWGLARNEFTDNDNWPHQIYVREARRMVSDYVMTELDCRGKRTAEDPVGLAAYTMDSHHVQRFVNAAGQVQNEGDVQVHGGPPYPISYRSIVPKADQCTNLLLPVCVSSSHIAFGSIRMEPVFMVLGQSAATAAVQAIEQQCNVQGVAYPKLRGRLIADRQVLGWPPKGLH